MVINFFGRRGSGKTTAIRGNIKYCRPPIFVVDVLGNFHEDDYIQVNSISEALEYSKTWLREKPKERIEKGKCVIVLKTGDPTLACEYFSSALWKIEGGTLILDEVDSIDLKEGSCFDEYIRYGRNHNGDLLTGCRRPAELSRNITAGANKFYCFSTHEFRDIEYFSNSVFGDRAFELQTMPRFTGLYLDYDAELIGKFAIDVNGNIYHTETIALE